MESRWNKKPTIASVSMPDAFGNQGITLKMNKGHPYPDRELES
jgi:hypothetical protein